MAGERHHGEAVTPRLDGLDEELARLLDVDPSPEFAARVRHRIEAEPAPQGWGLAWKFTAAGAAVTLAAVVFVLSLPGARPVSIASAPIPGHARVPDLGRPPAVPSVSARHVPASPGPKAPPRRAEPAVIVDQGQRVALARMIQLVQEGRLDSTMLEPPASTALPVEANVEVAPLTVRPLEIVPIPGARTDYR